MPRHTTRLIPGSEYVTFFWSRQVPAGSQWTQGGTVYRHSIPVGNVSVGWLRKPRKADDPSTFTGDRLASYLRAEQRRRDFTRPAPTTP